MIDIIVIGNGPAGISAAIYAKRSGLEITVIGKDAGALAKTDKIENFYGFVEPISGSQLIENGILQAKRLGIHLLEDEVIGIRYENGFVVKTVNGGEYQCKSLILATGVGRTTPKIKGFEQFDGKGISYCAICDAFFYRGKDIAVLGSSEYALAEVMDLLPVANSVTVLTNGETPTTQFPPEVTINTNKIVSLNGDDVISSVTFEDGNTLTIAGMFVAIGVAGSSDLARKIGAVTNGKHIVVNDTMETNIPGFFAAGDCTGGLYQITKSIYEGSVAGLESTKFIRNNN